jgi:hypothetical protein
MVFPEIARFTAVAAASPPEVVRISWPTGHPTMVLLRT